MSAEGGSELLAAGCSLSDNRASGGGGVFGTGEETRVTVESSAFENNVATKEGGGVRAFALGQLRVERCVRVRSLCSVQQYCAVCCKLWFDDVYLGLMTCI